MYNIYIHVLTLYLTADSLDSELYLINNSLCVFTK